MVKETSIAHDAARAFVVGDDFCRQNTVVLTVRDEYTDMLFYSTPIARRYHSKPNELHISLGGYTTTTTFKRLRVLIETWCKFYAIPMPEKLFYKRGNKVYFASAMIDADATITLRENGSWEIH